MLAAVEGALGALASSEAESGARLLADMLASLPSEQDGVGNIPTITTETPSLGKAVWASFSPLFVIVVAYYYVCMYVCCKCKVRYLSQ